MTLPFHWLGGEAESDEVRLIYRITGNQFFEDDIIFLPEIDLTDPQSDE